MIFLVFMLIVDLIVPSTMICLGRYFMEKAPKDINYTFGYRTARSMKNRDTWEFAHKHFGKSWYVTGLVLLPVSIFAICAFLGKDVTAIATVGGIICVLQLIPCFVPVILTDHALKHTFDQNGIRK